MKRMLSLILAVLLLCSVLPAASADEAENPFQDVDPQDYYYVPVVWAVYYDITTGTSDTTFSPEAPCTRAQVVTFLWRAAGSSVTEKNETAFKDIHEDAYYYNAVLWAVDNGITTGISAAAFGPEATCNRAQIVTFLYRYIYADGPLTIVSQSEVFYMEGYYQAGALNVEIKGGAAPYFYQLIVCYDDEVSYEESEVTEKTNCTLYCNLDGNDFEVYSDIYAYFIIQDSSGATVISEPIKIYPEFSVLHATQDYCLSSAREVASFEVEMTGGTAPYTYQWVVRYDNEEFFAEPQTSDSKKNLFEHEFFDADFDEHYTVAVCCIVTDSHGREARSSWIPVQPAFSISTQPTDYQMQQASDLASFYIITRGGGSGALTYEWFIRYDDKDVSIISEVTLDERSDFSHYFSEADFEKYESISVYCVVKDSNGTRMESDLAQVIPYKE